MFRQVTLPEGIRGSLYLHSMPGRFEPVREYLEEAKRLGVGKVISLAPLHEIKQVSGDYAEAIRAGLLPGELRMFPIPDWGVPQDTQGFLALAQESASDLRSGSRILVHCGAGVGRTGTFVAAVLMCLGLSLPGALDRVRQAGSGPETEGQRELLKALAGRVATE